MILNIFLTSRVVTSPPAGAFSGIIYFYSTGLRPWLLLLRPLRGLALGEESNSCPSGESPRRGEVREHSRIRYDYDCAYEN